MVTPAIMHLFFTLALLSSCLAKKLTNVTTVHVIQTCHLDVGFADTAAGELANYHQFLLEAANISQDFRNNPGQYGEGLVFTTHSYIVSLLLDRPPGMGFASPNATDQAIIRSAIQRGDIVMQAFPFNSEPETFVPGMFSAALDLTARVSASLGVPVPVVMSQRDVPGATRSMIPLLVAKGVIGYTGGVNGASLPPALPKAFVWRDPVSDTSILATLHPFGYGGITYSDCVVLDGLSHALCMDYNGDNAGPWNRTQIEQHWSQLRSEFPGANIIPSTYDRFFREMETVRSSLPVVTQEMGDTWIYGVPSDPLKLARYRQLMRAYDACVTGDPAQCDPRDPRVLNFTRLAIKVSEHTWGGDVKTFLNDEIHWDNPSFHALQYDPAQTNYQFITNTWVKLSIDDLYY
jgi:hypothetical protein